MNRLATPSLPSAPPWWRFRMAWVVFALPASAVVASTVSAVIAVRHADPVVAARPAGDPSAQGSATLPAEQARNHASLRR